jgi:hypothetical protein
MKFSLSVFLVICILFISVKNSHAFRCGNEIVSRWDTAASAEAKCGHPYQISNGTENIKGYIEYVQNWFYNCGDNDFIYQVMVSNGIIIKINSIQRGIGIGQCK